MSLINKIKTKKFDWINIAKPNAGSIEYLRQNFKFHPLELEDCINPSPRAKLDDFDDHLFIIMNFPIFDRKTRKISLSELDIFIGKDYLITINDGQLEPIKKIFDNCQINQIERTKYLNDDTTFLLYQIIDNLQQYCLPILSHIDQDLDNVENRIFNNEEKEMVREILIIKRNIVNFRKSVQSHKNVIKKLGKMSYKDFVKDDLDIYFANVLEQSKEIWETIENEKEIVDALHGTNESLISFKLNTIMKALTIISVLVFPATLISSMFGMNFIIPFQASQYGFLGAITVITICMIILFLYFKKKDWLD
ncbi:MAG: magnesium transporter CorA family protein [Patescibacteria group bacterium]|nr:magnesium transporter CorA family protein [Patescibacteria group bacterium]MDD4304258.1 magnesium transporter CorA family protein [Patescibacteria group bacterium]MDD4695312.1 magnesium transporter CorA family protein [Patescibacteria group bacterium]